MLLLKYCYACDPYNLPAQRRQISLLQHYGNTCTVQSNTRAYWSIIEMAVRTVENTGSQYHVLLIIADVQVSHFVAVLQNLNPSHLLFGLFGVIWNIQSIYSF
ncbi:hypothetical protein MKW92_053725 [Papaver armeniacum]|nr:hypothetical protein MKW92_053725 [Papaver armeniacum]